MPTELDMQIYIYDVISDNCVWIYFILKISCGVCVLKGVTSVHLDPSLFIVYIITAH